MLVDGLRPRVSKWANAGGPLLGIKERVIGTRLNPALNPSLLNLLMLLTARALLMVSPRGTMADQLIALLVTNGINIWPPRFADDSTIMPEEL